MLEKQENEEEKMEIKKMTVAVLSDFLSKELKKNNYKDLSVSRPQIGRDLIVSFTVQDAKLDREKYDSKNDLRKLLQKLLENTNWHLMSNGLDYKLGVLCGRLRGQDLK